MLKKLQDSYDLYYNDNIYFKERIDLVRKEGEKELKRYISDEIPLFVSCGGKIRYVTMTMIESELADNCSKGKSFVEYQLHKHHYPGFKGDNISFLTGKYYMYSKDYANLFREVPGAPSYLEALRAKLPGVLVTFREVENDNGILRVELP